MNNAVRSYLINKAISYEPVHYEDVVNDCKLGLDLRLNSDRKKLSKVLEDVSSYEHAHNRPLISSVAIYKLKKDHGYGFYEVASKLLNKKKQVLQNELWGFVELRNCQEYWSNQDNYNTYYAIEKVHSVPFYEISDIEFLKKWASKVYDKTDEEHVAAKNFIMATCGTKAKYWSNELVKRLPGFEAYNPRIWSQKGWDKSSGTNKTVTKFKHYSWARIYKKGDADYDIFFTVEANGKEECLVYKLDYYFEGVSNLSTEQQEIVKSNIPPEIRWKTIKFDDLKNMDWETLLNLTANFIASNVNIYDKLIELAWNKEIAEDVFRDNLIFNERKLNALAELPKLTPTFKGYQSDHLELNRVNKELGDIGEDLVIKYEQKKLRTLGLSNLADEVKRAEDGNGYDVLSFDEHENPFYIEVKTTTGTVDTPFYLSINERLFAQQNADKYVIYRIYNYDEVTNMGHFYKIVDIENTLLFQPMNFLAYNREC